ncbi:DUF1289 domain-containing protein [Polymorphobacter sp.]|uniref:DUF1289 domain-containing protein n=1 Tax=Polymorphobacter sp. TaxID=1909290 RepID=UPI003F6F3A93
MTASPSSPALRSPCINICRIERRSGLCEGCKRNVDEIMAWPTASDERKRAILAALPLRSVGRSWGRKGIPR